jgi:hypothetical protein
MATIADVRLLIAPLGENASVHIAFDVEFDAFDVASNQLYQQSWALAGSGHLGGAGLARGVEQGALDIVRFAADGRLSARRDIELVIPWEQLEQGPTDANELRAIITLTPVGPFGDSAESNRVDLAVPLPPQ